MRRARPPVGVQSTEEQVEQSTTDWEWENTVVLREETVGEISQRGLPGKEKTAPTPSSNGSS